MRDGESKQDINCSFRLVSEVLVHSNDRCFLYLLHFSTEVLLLRVLQLRTPTQLRKPSDDQVSDLVELRIAGHEEHVPRDTVLKHGLARDSVVTQCQEDPGDVSLDHFIVDRGEAVKQVHHTLLDQDAYGLFVQREVD